MGSVMEYEILRLDCLIHSFGSCADSHKDWSKVTTKKTTCSDVFLEAGQKLTHSYKWNDIRA